MKNLVLTLISGIVLIGVCEGIENFLENDLYKCVECLCHARTGCWRRQNCASYSIDREYWELGGALTVGGGSKGTNDYQRCMSDENCIVGTIIRYTHRFGARDCNCDGKFDCKDIFAIHLFGGRCENPKFTHTYARRFNECAAKVGVNEMLSEEGNNNCSAPDIV